jgi:hypothetical protein
MTMPGQIAKQVTVIAAQPAMLVIGDRQIPIDESPLGRSVDERRSVELIRPSDHLLVIEPKRRAGATIVFQTVLVFLGGALPSVLAAIGEIPWWVGILIALPVVSLLLLFIRGQLRAMRWFRFDRADGQLVIERRTGFRRERREECIYSFKAIHAVQLLHSGIHSVTAVEGPSDRQTTSHREFHGYELNLILDDAKIPRLNLFSFSDWEWIRQTGQTIGEFIGIPVIDKLYHGG